MVKNWKDLVNTDHWESVNEAEVGVIFDWDNYWALEYTSGPSDQSQICGPDPHAITVISMKKISVSI